MVEFKMDRKKKPIDVNDFSLLCLIAKDNLEFLASTNHSFDSKSHIYQTISFNPRKLKRNVRFFLCSIDIFFFFQAWPLANRYENGR